VRHVLGNQQSGRDVAALFYPLEGELKFAKTVHETSAKPHPVTKIFIEVWEHVSD
jgi:hypothetical protein